MLRRKAGNIVEFRQLEEMLARSAPSGLSVARREALWLRISSQLGEQDQAPATLRFLPPRERWIAIPAGAGLAAAIVAGAVLVAEHMSSPTNGVTAHAVGDLLVDGQQSNDVQPGAMLVARSSTWVSVGTDIRVGLDTGAIVRYDYANGSVALHLFSGDVTVAATVSGVNLNGDGWSAVLGPGTLVSASTVAGYTSFQVEEGTATLTFGGSTRTLGPNDPAVHIGNGAPTAPSSDEIPPVGRGVGDTAIPSAPAGTDAGTTAPHSQSSRPTDTTSSSTAPPDGTTAPPSNGAVAPPQSPGQSSSAPAADPPGRLVEDTPGGNANGSQAAPPSENHPDPGAGATQPNPPAPGTGSGNGNGNGAGASGDSPANPHDSGTATGNPHGTTDTPANPNASDPPANAHASDPSANPHAAGDGSDTGAVAPAPGNSADAPGQEKKLADPSSPVTTPAGTTSSAPPNAQGNAASAPGHTGDPRARGRRKEQIKISISRRKRL